MRISKIKDVKTPQRGTSKSAGLDFFVPEDFSETIVKPGNHIRIGSGIRVEIPAGYALIAFNKSGVALSGLSVGACVIDEDYQGEINLHLFNETVYDIAIKPGQKLVQFILIPVLYDEVEVVDDAELHVTPSERGAGGFGSTGDGITTKKDRVKKEVSDAISKITMPKAVNYICIGMAGLDEIDNDANDAQERGKVYVYLMPKISIKFKDKPEVDAVCAELCASLGPRYEIVSCPTYSELIFNNSIVIESPIKNLL